MEVIMPGFNQKGPRGQGSLTGRKMGRCTNYGANTQNFNAVTKENNDEIISKNMQGRGLRLGRGKGGRGFGMGRQNRYEGDK